MKKLLLFALFLPCFSWAAGIGFTDLTESEFKDVIEEFGAGWVHTSVSPASSLGKIFGFEVGVIAGTSKSEKIDEIAKSVDSSADADQLPHAGILGVVTFPLGISGEINFLPEIKNSDVDMSSASLAVKWTFTDLFPLPVDMAVKLYSGSSQVKWNQPISTVATDVEYEQKVSGLLFQVSKKFTIFEPYVSIGTVNTTGKMTSSGGTVFNAGYTSASSAEEEVSGGQFLLGANLNLLIFKVGLEAGKVLDKQTASFKASLYF